MKFKLVKKSAVLLTFESEKVGKEPTKPLLLGYGSDAATTGLQTRQKKSFLFFSLRGTKVGDVVEIDVEESAEGRLYAAEHDTLKKGELEYLKHALEIKNVNAALAAKGTE